MFHHPGKFPGVIMAPFCDLFIERLLFRS